MPKKKVNKRLKQVYKKADNTKRHDLTPKEIEAMDNDVYD